MERARSDISDPSASEETGPLSDGSTTSEFSPIRGLWRWNMKVPEGSDTETGGLLLFGEFDSKLRGMSIVEAKIKESVMPGVSSRLSRHHMKNLSFRPGEDDKPTVLSFSTETPSGIVKRFAVLAADGSSLQGKSTVFLDPEGLMPFSFDYEWTAVRHTVK